MPQSVLITVILFWKGMMLQFDVLSFIFKSDVDRKRSSVFPQTHVMRRKRKKNMQINGKKELALALVLYACLRPTVTQNKDKTRMLAASFCSFFWDLGGHEKAIKNTPRHPYKELLSEAYQGGFKNILSFPCKTASVVINYLTCGTYRRLKIRFRKGTLFVYVLMANVTPFQTHKGWGSGLQKMFFGPSGLSWV